ncbi:MAG: J domain-containing protein [Flavobacteriales bacterium]|nr:J domain-containing protein [Flavobacteriales bacterium]
MRQYFQILGLPNGSSVPEIKKRYRELVLRYHPDVNKSDSAHEDFIRIKLAYEKLMGDHLGVENLYAQYQAKKNPPGRTQGYEESDTEYKERMRERARQFARERYKEARETELRVFRWLTKGVIWKLVRFCAGVSVLFALITLFEFWLPPHQDTYQISSKVYYEYFQRNTLFSDNAGSVDVPELVFIKVAKSDVVNLEYSAMSKEFLGYRISKKSGEDIFIPNRFNFFLAYPLFPLLFFVPGMLFYFQKNEVSFYLLYFVSLVAYPALLIHFMFREQKLKFILEFVGF